jgi:hypothetical protein
LGKSKSSFKKTVSLLHRHIWTTHAVASTTITENYILHNSLTSLIFFHLKNSVWMVRCSINNFYWDATNTYWEISKKVFALVSQMSTFRPLLHSINVLLLFVFPSAHSRYICSIASQILFVGWSTSVQNYIRFYMIQHTVLS